jgi:hypothetical protein
VRPGDAIAAWARINGEELHHTQIAFTSGGTETVHVGRLGGPGDTMQWVWGDAEGFVRPTRAGFEFRVEMEID